MTKARRGQRALRLLIAAALIGTACAAQAKDDQPGRLKLGRQGNTQTKTQTQTKPSGPEAMVQRMDLDGDGRISAAEFRGPQQKFKALDGDGDGFVTAAEIAAAQQGGGKAAAGAGGGDPRAAWYKKLPVILTHTHFNAIIERGRNLKMDWQGAEADALRVMDEHGIRAAIIMPTPSLGLSSGSDETFHELLRIAAKHPDRFRVSGGAESLNSKINATSAEQIGDADRRTFAAHAEQIAAAGAVGFGEFSALHFSLFDGHVFGVTQPDHPLFLALADVAAKHDMPIDLHMEPVVQDWTVSERLRNLSRKNPDRVRENIAELERLLAHNPQAKIIWVHIGVDNTGQRSIALTRRMLQSHPNLYLSVSCFQTATEYWFVKPGLGLNPEWRALILEFPDRFMIGSDTFFQTKRSAWHTFPQPVQLATMVVRTPALPPAVARKVAFENAQRIFHLDLIDADDYPLPAGQTESVDAAPADAPNAAPDGEVVGPRGLTARQVIAQSDRNGDGRLAMNEFKGPPPKFHRLDADGDGFITAAEFETRWRAGRGN